MGLCASKGPEPSSKPSTAAVKRLEQNAVLKSKAQNGKTTPTSTVTQTNDTTNTPATDANATANANAKANSNSNTAQASKPAVETTGVGSNGAIEEPVTSEKEVKVLLLGSGESGKSTIVKQMKILHQNGYTQEELYEYKPFVYRNILESIKNVINAIIDLEPQLINTSPELAAIKSKEQEIQKLSESNEQNENDLTRESNNNNNDKPTISLTDGKDGQEETHVNGTNKKDEVINGSEIVKTNGSTIENGTTTGVLDYDVLNDILDYEFTMNIDDVFDPSIAQKIISVYNTPEVQDFIKFQQGNFYLIDSTNYFLKDISRISQPDYIPTVSDVLRTRKKTSGIFDFKFQMLTGLNIHMYDVGGQRSERKKWIHCFDNVTLIIFCVALSEYDQVLLEENTQNRLVESLNLFDSVVNSVGSQEHRLCYS